MNFSKYRLALVAASVITLSSCDKELNQANPNAATSASFWKTADDAVKGVNSCYQTFLEDGGYMRFTPLLLNVPGDDVRSGSPWTAMSNAGKFQLGTADNAGYGWAFDEFYQGVSRCNQVLKYVPAIDMDQNLKNRVLGQAYFLRGLYYFHLVDMWGNVPLPTEVGVVAPQATAEQGWQRVIEDFTQAVSLLPAQYEAAGGPDANDKGRATKGAAMAYLGKALLFNKKYAEAATQFKAVIDLGIYDLASNYKDNFSEAGEYNKESVFELNFSLTAGGTDLQWQGIPSSTWGFYSARAITFAPPNFGWTDVQPTKTLLADFREEKTVDGKIDPRASATMFYNDTADTKLPTTPMYQTTFQASYAADPARLAEVFCRKYENGEGTKPNEFDWKSGINERLMRYSDVLLMYAECLNEQGQTAAAVPFIQKVRSRAKLADRTAEFAGYTQAKMRDQIAHERLLEFPLEGHRFDDIRRWGWLSDATKLAWLKSRDPEMNSYIPGKELLPIPQTEIDNNPGVKQNPTY